MKRWFSGIAPVAILSLLLLAALAMMSAATQNSALFSRMYSLLLVINILGIVMLLALILANLKHLATQYRNKVMGSRLTLRLLGFFVLLAVTPVTVVYFFSIQAFNKGIDNWFDVKIERALDDALALGRTALDAIKDDLSKKTRDMAFELEAFPDRMVAPILDDLREQYGVTEITLFAQDGKIIAASSLGNLDSKTLVPDRPNETILSQARQGKSFATIDALGKSGLQLRVVAPVSMRDVGAPLRILQVQQQLPDRYSKLGESVQVAFAEYEKLIYLRGPLKFGFILTLSLVALLTLLIAVWAAIYSARRLVTPIRDLAEGTRAVAQGNYRKQLPVPGGDELGILVKSFNEMTRRIHRAQTQTKHSQREAEVQRTYLETVLTHLSSGVLSFDPRARLRTYNTSAEQILGVSLEPGVGRSLQWILDGHPHLAPFVQTLQDTAHQERAEWHAETSLEGHAGKRTLILRGTRLPGLRARHGGHVVVFDDISALIQAQRDAAWSEVARRLAHEIKNPLTPIRLSAERIRLKCMDGLSHSQQQTLERATRTIVEQVEAMKSMVNAFTEYARPVQIQPVPVDLNLLINDVVELYRGRQNPVRIQLNLDPALQPINADPGRLRQVLHNLLLNANDALAATAEPLLRISTRYFEIEGRRVVELEAHDNGPGFAPSVLDHLFEPYVTTKEKGTGLGLAIVKKIVEEHSGSLWATNPADGGALLVIRLPMDAVFAQTESHGTGLARERSA
jgi:nitrogen fixation/metabolism regulation signal transduction histidine kinase